MKEKNLDFIYNVYFIHNFFHLNDLIWQDAFLIDYAQKKSVNKWVQKFLIISSYLYNERLVFDFIIKFLYNNILIPLQKLFFFNTFSIANIMFFIFSAILFIFISFNFVLIIFCFNTISDFAIILAILSLLLTLFTVLTERKFLAYSQRRMGPTLIGRNGSFQIGLDLVKLLTKEVFLIPKSSSILAPFFLALFFSVQLLFSQNFIFSVSLTIFSNVDSLILYHLILILLGNVFFVIVGLLSQSRYAIIGTVRALVHVISLDIFITVIYSFLIISSQSAQFNDFIISQTSYWLIYLYLPLCFVFVVLLLLEAKRAPFDHAETESEVVAGYAVEYSGAMMMIFLLTEYLHLLISSAHFVLFFLGGNFLYVFLFYLPSNFLVPHEILYYFWIF